MDWSVVLAVTVLAAAAAVFAPLRRRREPWGLPGDARLEALLREKNRVLRALLDLDHERVSGLLDPEDHAQARRDYLERAARLNRAIAAQTGIDPTEWDPAVRPADLPEMRS